MICPICGNNLKAFSYSNYCYLNGTVLRVPVFYCKSCNTFIKKIDDVALSSYFKNSVWTQTKYEDTTFHSRRNFYDYILKLTKRYNNSILNWIDFGSSYGHFVEFLNERKIRSVGIELSDDAQNYAQQKGLIIFKKIEDLPQEMTFDVVSLIDSLYYSQTPKIELKQIYNKLNVNGIIILRIVNRNWLVKYNKYVLHKPTVTALIDHSIGFSKKSISYLLENGGFQILKTTNIEYGKILSAKIKCFYLFSLVVNFISMGLINFSPGIIIIAKKIPGFYRPSSGSGAIGQD